MQDFEYYQPRSLPDLTRLLDETGGKLIAGGTDLLVQMRRKKLAPSCILDISRIDELHFIRENDGKIAIGALTTHQELIESSLIQKAAPSLVQAAATIGCPQTRHRGTLGGNIANGSPAADTIPPLLTLDAELILVSSHGQRQIPLVDFFAGPGQTLLLPGEVITCISFSCPAESWGSSFVKLGKRNGMAISVVSVAALVIFRANREIGKARIAMGSVAPTPVRCRAAEDVLTGFPVNLKVFQLAAEKCLDDISPISDLRASADYRYKAAQVNVHRALEQALEYNAKRSA